MSLNFSGGIHHLWLPYSSMPFIQRFRICSNSRSLWEIVSNKALKLVFLLFYWTMSINSSLNSTLFIWWPVVYFYFFPFLYFGGFLSPKKPRTWNDSLSASHIFENVMLGSGNETQDVKQEGGGGAGNIRLDAEVRSCSLSEDVPWEWLTFCLSVALVKWSPVGHCITSHWLMSPPASFPSFPHPHLPCSLPWPHIKHFSLNLCYRLCSVEDWGWNKVLCDLKNTFTDIILYTSF